MFSSFSGMWHNILPLKMTLFIYFFYPLCNHLNCVVKIIFISYLLLYMYMVFKLNERIQLQQSIDTDRFSPVELLVKKKINLIFVNNTFIT